MYTTQLSNRTFTLVRSSFVTAVVAASVLVHGADGTDSTLQVTSLAQLILDPDCRTVRGYVVSFGRYLGFFGKIVPQKEMKKIATGIDYVSDEKFRSQT